ncbi:MAG: hypothetical protein QF637_00690 [Acidimicrobiales bacterium]|nr:hypothetical protein [Acidimicrobiales bacterium]
MFEANPTLSNDVSESQHFGNARSRKKFATSVSVGMLEANNSHGAENGSEQGSPVPL